MGREIRYTTVLTACALLLLSRNALAQTNAYFLSAPPVINGNQAYTGSLGMDFDVNSPISVTRLGVFDSGQDGINGTVRVTIFNRVTQAIVAGMPTFAFTGASDTLIGAYRFRNIATPVTLPVGQYSVVAWGYSSSERNGNTVAAGGFPTPVTNTGGGNISFVGRSRFIGLAGAYPTSLGTRVSQFGAGTFSFNAVVTAPEPGTAMLLLSVLGLGVPAIRYRKQ